MKPISCNQESRKGGDRRRLSRPEVLQGPAGYRVNGRRQVWQSGLNP